MDRTSSADRRLLPRLWACAKRHPLWALAIAFVVVGSATVAVLSIGAWPIHVLRQGTHGATDIDVDPNGNLHVVLANGRLWYASNLGWGWSVSLLDDVHEVWDASLATDSRGVVHVAYTAFLRVDGRSTPHTVRYLSLSGGAIGSEELVDASGWYPDIAVDPTDVVHVTYASPRTFDLIHATQTAGTWRNETAVADEAWSAVYSAIAVDSRGVVHATTTASHSDIGYATNEGGPWTSGWLIRDGNSNERVPIAIDDRDRVHIAYSACAPGCDSARIIYAVREDGSWNQEVVATRGIIGRVFVDLALGPSGIPHILFSDRDDEALHHASKTNDAWRSSIVDRSTITIQGGSIAVGPDGTVAVAYSRLDGGEGVSGTSVRVAAYGVSMDNLADFVRGIGPYLLMEGGVFLAAGLLHWRRSRRASRGEPVLRT